MILNPIQVIHLNIIITLEHGYLGPPPFDNSGEMEVGTIRHIPGN